MPYLKATVKKPQWLEIYKYSDRDLQVYFPNTVQINISEWWIIHCYKNPGTVYTELHWEPYYWERNFLNTGEMHVDIKLIFMAHRHTPLSKENKIEKFIIIQLFQIWTPDRHARTVWITGLHIIQQQKQKTHRILTHTCFDFPQVGGRKQKKGISAWLSKQTWSYNCKHSHLGIGFLKTKHLIHNNTPVNFTWSSCTEQHHL